MIEATLNTWLLLLLVVLVVVVVAVGWFIQHPLLLPAVEF
jgi:hypothetical protein